MSIVSGGLQSAKVSQTATGDVVTAVSGQRIYVVSYILNHSAASVTSAWTDGSTTVEGAWAPGANGTRSECASAGSYLFATTSGAKLALTQSGTGTVAGRVTYYVGY